MRSACPPPCTRVGASGSRVSPRPAPARWSRRLEIRDGARSGPRPRSCSSSNEHPRRCTCPCELSFVEAPDCALNADARRASRHPAPASPAEARATPTTAIRTPANHQAFPVRPTLSPRQGRAPACHVPGHPGHWGARSGTGLSAASSRRAYSERHPSMMLTRAHFASFFPRRLLSSRPFRLIGPV